MLRYIFKILRTCLSAIDGLRKLNINETRSEKREILTSKWPNPFAKQIGMRRHFTSDVITLCCFLSANKVKSEVRPNYWRLRFHSVTSLTVSFLILWRWRLLDCLLVFWQVLRSAWLSFSVGVNILWGSTIYLIWKFNPKNFWVSVWRQCLGIILYSSVQAQSKIK